MAKTSKTPIRRSPSVPKTGASKSPKRRYGCGGKISTKK